MKHWEFDRGARFYWLPRFEWYGRDKTYAGFAVSWLGFRVDFYINDVEAEAEKYDGHE